MVERITRVHLVGGGLFTWKAVAVLLGGLCAFILVAGALVVGSQGDNCCYNAGWSCRTENEWIAGYYAFGNGECPVAEPASVSVQDRSQVAAAGASVSASASSAVSGNCCNNPGWRCTTNNEWIGGYYSALASTCDVRPAVWQADVTPSVQATPTQRPRARSESSEPETETISGYANVKVYDQDGNVVDDVVVRRPTRQELCDAGLVEFCDEG